MPVGWTFGVGRGNSVTTPAVVIRPIWLALLSVNQRAPSGPDVMKLKVPPPVTGNSVTEPEVVIRPIWLTDPPSVNQRAPSGPAAIL